MSRLSWLASLAVVAAFAAESRCVAQTKAQHAEARKKLVDHVLVPSGIKNPRVLEVMGSTPRHEFVAAAHRKNAYEDMSLPIGDQQTISSPFIVAYMTESLDPRPTDKVLEIGTGSGYQAAILSPLVKEVYSIEIVEPLGKHAAATLKRLNYANVFTKVGDGFQGWPEHAPFDKIIVTCSPEKVPQPLVEQLSDGGLIVVPVGERYQQTLYLFRKNKGQLESEALRPTLFVPMTGRAEEIRQVQPDPRNPTIRNGNFEEVIAGVSYIPGWYYERLATIEEDRVAPEGTHVLSFSNDQPGRSAHLLQGFALDGRHVREVELSAQVRHENVTQGRDREETAYIAITFYDQNRKELGATLVGPFRGTSGWTKHAKNLRVPEKAREAILRVGLFGATGKAWFDDIEVKKKDGE